jgi:hypothetical protein
VGGGGGDGVVYGGGWVKFAIPDVISGFVSGWVTYVDIQMVEFPRWTKTRMNILGKPSTFFSAQ